MTSGDEDATRDVAYRLGEAMLDYARAAMDAGHSVTLSYEIQDSDARPVHFVMTCTTTPAGGA